MLASTCRRMLQKWVKHLAELAHPAGGIRPSRSPAELSALGSGRPWSPPQLLLELPMLQQTLNTAHTRQALGVRY